MIWIFYQQLSMRRWRGFIITTYPARIASAMARAWPVTLGSLFHDCSSPCPGPRQKPSNKSRVDPVHVRARFWWTWSSAYWRIRAQSFTGDVTASHLVVARLIGSTAWNMWPSNRKATSCPTPRKVRRWVVVQCHVKSRRLHVELTLTVANPLHGKRKYVLIYFF